MGQTKEANRLKNSRVVPTLPSRVIDPSYPKQCGTGTNSMTVPIFPSHGIDPTSYPKQCGTGTNSMTAVEGQTTFWGMQ
jgi:hypothetical protein